MSPPRKRVLFVCTHNSARSQIAEGLLRAWADDRFEVFSAGTQPTEVRPEAIAVMAEIGVDISNHRAKHLDEFHGQSFEWLITVCDRAWQECSAVPGVENPAHWGSRRPLGDLTSSGSGRVVRSQLAPLTVAPRGLPRRPGRSRTRNRGRQPSVPGAAARRRVGSQNAAVKPC